MSQSTKVSKTIKKPNRLERDSDDESSVEIPEPVQVKRKETLVPVPSKEEEEGIVIEKKKRVPSERQLESLRRAQEVRLANYQKRKEEKNKLVQQEKELDELEKEELDETPKKALKKTKKPKVVVMEEESSSSEEEVIIVKPKKKVKTEKKKKKKIVYESSSEEEDPDLTGEDEPIIRKKTSRVQAPKRRPSHDRDEEDVPEMRLPQNHYANYNWA